jgi:hypothetical protein
MSTFDQQARLASKLDGGGFFAWVLSRVGAPPSLAFHRWEDARRLAVIPGLERIDDAVAVLRDSGRPDDDQFLIVEFETEPRRHLFKRLGIYALLLSTELSVGPGPEEEPPVGACVLALTGSKPRRTLRVGLPGTDRHVTVEPWVLNLADEDAAATVAAVLSGTLARCVLAWVPLMSGAGERTLIDRWKDAVSLELDPALREVYASHALIFAELTQGLVNWQQALEGWMARESQLILGWKREGMLEGEVKTRRGDVLKVLQVRLANPVPEPVRVAVEGTNDPDILGRWLELAATAGDFDEFLRAIASPQ